MATIKPPGPILSRTVGTTLSFVLKTSYKFSNLYLPAGSQELSFRLLFIRFSESTWSWISIRSVARLLPDRLNSISSVHLSSQNEYGEFRGDTRL